MTWDINSVIDKNTIQSYEIYGFENDLTHTNNLWTLIGEVKALPLPMACILRLVSLINLNNNFIFVKCFPY